MHSKYMYTAIVDNKTNPNMETTYFCTKRPLFAQHPDFACETRTFKKNKPFEDTGRGVLRKMIGKDNEVRLGDFKRFFFKEITSTKP